MMLKSEDDSATVTQDDNALGSRDGALPKTTAVSEFINAAVTCGILSKPCGASNRANMLPLTSECMCLIP
jgi:hypothetical protein